jgi:hypothetical protein
MRREEGRSTERRDIHTVYCAMCANTNVAFFFSFFLVGGHSFCEGVYQGAEVELQQTQNTVYKASK